VAGEAAGETAGEATAAATGPATGPNGALDGIIAGLGFGVSFTGLAQVPEHAGYWPLATAQTVSVAAVIATCFLMGGTPWPRRPAEFTGLVGGVLASLAIWFFLLATHRGMLTVSSVVVSLYPAATVILAITLLREHVHRAQAIGLALCAATVALVALG
jgi:drug/metabolite transporter (DMT)-like permease